MNLIVMLFVCAQEKAGRLAQQLIEQRLAACVDILPSSLNLLGWRPDSFERGQATLLITTNDELTDGVVESLKAGGAWESERAAVVCLEIKQSYSSYIKWAEGSLMEGEDF